MFGPTLTPLDFALAGGTPSLDIRAHVGTSTSPTSTGTKPVTGVGFTPKIILPFGTLLPSSTVTTDGLLCIGAATSASSRAAISGSSQNALTTSVTSRRHTNGGIVTAHWPALGSSLVDADLSSMNADGFTGNWSTVQASAYILNHIALGGADLEVSVVQCQMNGTNANESFPHGLSGAPTGVFAFSIANAAAPANTTTILRTSVGAWAGANQFAALTYSNNGVTTTATRRSLYTTGICGFTTGTIQRLMAVSSVDSTNVNVTYPVTTSSAQPYFWMICIRGAKCQVGTFDCNGSTSPLPITCAGIIPKLFLPVFVPEAVDSLGSVIADVMLTIGASDGVSNVSCGISDRSAVTTTEARRYQTSDSLTEYNQGGALRFEGAAAFAGESVVLTPTTNINASFGQGGYLILGS